MTTEEMFQLLMNELKEVRSEIKAVRTDVAELKHGQVDLLDKILALKLVTIHIDDSVTKNTTEFKGYRHFSQGAIHDVQVRQQHLEDRVEAVEQKLDKAS